MEEVRSDLKISTDKPIGKKSLVRPRRIFEDNIRIELKILGVNTRNWMDSLRMGVNKRNWISSLRIGIIGESL